jgi:hypothetical protein
MIYFERQGRQDAAMQQAVALLHVRGEDKRAAKEYVSPLRIAILAMRAGNIDKAFAWLDVAINARSAGLVYLRVDPKYARLRSDPRFARDCERVGLK